MEFVWRKKQRRLFEEGYIGTPLSSVSRALMTLKPGNVLEGEVLKKGEDGFLVRVGDGILALLPEEETTGSHSAGSTVRGSVKTIDPISARVVISEKEAQEKDFFAECLRLMQEGTWLEGEIAKVVKGGFLIPVRGRMAILPFSQVVPSPLQPENDLGKTKRFRVMQVDEDARKIVLTQKEREKKPLLLEKGTVLQGVVTKIVPYGAFVRIGEHTGLVHKSEISWLRVHDIEDFVVEGQEVEVEVIGVDEENDKISLSMKRTQPNPWEKVDEYFKEGQSTEGVVIHHAPFGMFLNLMHGLEGLLHVSEIPEEKRKQKEDLYPLGATVRVKILSIDKEHFRIALTLP